MKPYSIVSKSNNIYQCHDKTDDTVCDCTIYDILNNYDNFEGISFDLLTLQYHIDFDNTYWKLVKTHRVFKTVINKTNFYFDMLDNYGFLSKNLYNHANYIKRQAFFNNEQIPSWTSLYTITLNDIDYPDFKNMPTNNTGKQVLKCLDGEWSSFFKLQEKFKKDPKHNQKPNLPRYKDKTNGRYKLVVPNTECRIDKKTGTKILFNKHFKGFSIDIPKNINIQELNQVEFKFNKEYIVAYATYSTNQWVEVTDKEPEIKRFISIDLGLGNLAAITNNIDKEFMLIDGKGLKSINHYYNKTKSKRMSELAASGLKYSKRLRRLDTKRNRKVEDYLHKASRYIINYCKDNNIDTIILGYNKGWKQNIDLGKKTNQNFTGIPHYKLKSMLEYKSADAGINLIIIEESFTSGTSFLDNELPTKDYYNISRRIKRGLFKSNKGVVINADINASMQIAKKVDGNIWACPETTCVEALALKPVRIRIS